MRIFEDDFYNLHHPFFKGIKFIDKEIMKMEIIIHQFEYKLRNKLHNNDLSYKNIEVPVIIPKKVLEKSEFRSYFDNRNMYNISPVLHVYLHYFFDLENCSTGVVYDKENSKLLFTFDIIDGYFLKKGQAADHKTLMQYIDETCIWVRWVMKNFV